MINFDAKYERNTNSNMNRQALYSDVKTLVKAGYSDEDIRKTMVELGEDPKLVDKALFRIRH